MRLRDGSAEWYRNRYVRTPFIEDPSIDILDPAVMMKQVDHMGACGITLGTPAPV